MAITFQERVLDNGIRLIGEVDPEAHSAAAGYFVRTGARDESAQAMGVSHFLEHMMFKGPRDLSAEALNSAMDDLGASNNAYTSAELTCFYAHTLPGALPDAATLLGRMMRPALREEDFETERGVILEEIAMYDDNPFWVLLEAASERHYRGHALGHRVLGTKQTIEQLPVTTMRSYFDERYTAEATVVALAGALDMDEVARALEALPEPWTHGEPPPRGPAPETGAGRFEITRENVSRGYLLSIWQAPPIQGELRHAAKLLAQVLGEPGNSRLHWSLVEPGLADEAIAAYMGHDQAGDFVVYASGDPDKLESIESVIAGELEKAVDELDERDLERLRAKVATEVTVGGERPADRMQRLGSRWTLIGDYLPLEEQLEQVRAVSLDDLREVARRYPLRPQTTGLLRPA
ncbi:MAG: insulinase family protein [Phycisphaerales bacterium]|nr:insulinase family protein [Phycisphaerales bacterium]